MFPERNFDLDTRMKDLEKEGKNEKVKYTRKNELNEEKVR